MKIELTAVDVFIRSQSVPQQELGTDKLKLSEVFCRGTLLDPNSISNCLLTDVFQCRFQSKSGEAVIHLSEVSELLSHLEKNGLHWVQVQNVYDVEE